MYDELVKMLRTCAERDSCIGCREACHYLGTGVCDNKAEKAADAIEELLAERDEVNADSWKTAFEVERDEHRWIPVTERLPEVNKYVLGCFKDNSMTAVCLFGIDEHMTFWRACTDEGWEAECDSEPTHWMPLPEPPKEE